MNKKKLLISSALLLLLAIVVPKINYQGKAYDYLFIIDITRSMTTRDYQDREGNRIDRLDKVKQEVVTFIKSLPCGSRVGLGVFTERMPALLYSPVEVCENYNELKKTLMHIDWRMAWSADSNISKALYNTLKMLMVDDLSTTALVFMTDGHESPPVNPRYEPKFDDLNQNSKRNPIGVLEMARQNRMGMNQQVDFNDEVMDQSRPGIIVGVGGLTPARIPKYDEDGIQQGFYTVDDVPHASRFGLPEDPSKIEGYHPRNGPWGNKKVVGTEHLSSVREVYLKELAKKIDYDYIHLQGQESFNSLMKRDKYAKQTEQLKNISFIPAILSLVFFLLAYFVKPSRTV